MVHGRFPWSRGLLSSACRRLFVLFVLLAAMPHPAAARPLVLTTVAVGSRPSSVGVNASTNRIYVAHEYSNNVSVIDGSDNYAVRTVPVGIGPVGIGVNASTNRVYVAHGYSNNVSVIDGDPKEVLTTVHVGTAPGDVAVNERTNRIYVANRGSNNVSVIAGKDNHVVRTVPVGSSPVIPASLLDIGVNATTNRIYVAHYNSDNVSVIDGSTNTVVRTVPVGSSPVGIGVNATTNRVYVNRVSGNVSVIDGVSNAIITTVPVGGSAGAVGVNESTNRIYVAHEYSNNVSVIDGSTNTVVSTVPVGDGPVDIGVNERTNRIYVANRGSNNVSVIGEGVYSPNLPPGDLIDVGSATTGTPITNTTALTITSAGNAPLTITDLTLSGPNASDFQVNHVGFTVDPGASRTLSVQCTPSASGHRTASLSVGHDDNGSPAVYPLVCTGLPGADLGIQMSVAPDSVTAGSRLVYSLTVTNAGPSDASSVTLTEPLPPGTTFQSLSTPDGWSCRVPQQGVGGTITCTLPSVAASRNARLKLVVQVSSNTLNGAQLQNTVSVVSTAGDPDATNNTSTVTTTVVK